MSTRLNLFKEIIPAIDQNMKELWDMLDDDQKKGVAGDFWNLNRYISSVKTSNLEHNEHFLILVNELYNKNWASVSKENKLLWLLLCACSHDSKKTFFHEWIPLKRTSDGSTKTVQFLQKLYPAAKNDDLEVLAKITSKKELIKLAKAHGMDDKEINDLKL